MRAFIVICLLAVACADKLGYNYQPVYHSDSGLSFTPGLSSGSVSDFGGNLGGGVISTSSLGSGANLDGGFTGGLSGVSVGNTGVSGSHHDSSVNYAPQAELEKEFYTFTANEDDFSEPAIESQVSNSAKKNLRVIFIKGPENHGLENAAVALAKHSAEQKTDIYVLHKQADVSSLSHKLNSINNNINNKPEVHFVKYRTHEDAANAQKAIQSQYDSLGGNSQNYNGGVAPVLNFASKAPVAAHVSHGSVGGPVGSIGDSHGSFGTVGSTGSLGGSVGSIGGSHGSFGTVGSTGSSDLSAPVNSYIPPTVGGGFLAPSSTYLPSIVARHRK